MHFSGDPAEWLKQILQNAGFSYNLSAIPSTEAMIMLIFKDAIPGLVASIKLSADHMFQIGGRITMPARGADGEFDLKVLQNPSGDDLVKLSGTN